MNFMPPKNKKVKSKKRILWFSGFILLIFCFLAYYQLWYKSEKIESNIFKLNAVFSSHNSDVWTVMFSPDGNWLASGSVDSTVKVWNKENRELVLTLKQPSGVTYLAFSRDGNYLTTAAYDEKVRLWKLPEGTLVKEFTGHKGTVWSVNFSPDGKIITSSGEDASIKLWDVESGQLVRTLVGHTLNVWVVKFSPDGSQIASGSFDKTVKIWNANNYTLIHTLIDHSDAIVSLAFSPDGQKLASTSDDQTIKLWNTSDWNLIRTLEVPEHIQAADFSPDSKRLLTGGKDKTTIGELLQNFFGNSNYNKGVSMRLWNVETGKLLQTFSQHANDVNDVAYCPDGKWIASSSSDKTVELWRLSDR